MKPMIIMHVSSGLFDDRLVGVNDYAFDVLASECAPDEVGMGFRF
jgi:hypothetical protein